MYTNLKVVRLSPDKMVVEQTRFLSILGGIIFQLFGLATIFFAYLDWGSEGIVFFVLFFFSLFFGVGTWLIVTAINIKIIFDKETKTMTVFHISVLKSTCVVYSITQLDHIELLKFRPYNYLEHNRRDESILIFCLKDDKQIAINCTGAIGGFASLTPGLDEANAISEFLEVPLKHTKASASGWDGSHVGHGWYKKQK